MLIIFRVNMYLKINKTSQVLPVAIQTNIKKFMMTHFLLLYFSRFVTLIVLLNEYSNVKKLT